MLDKYKLSDHIHNVILEQLKLETFKNHSPSSQPEIYILGGQPGAGKSVLTERILKEHPQGNFVSINGDEFRTLHPDAREIFQKYDKDFALYTDPDTRLWTSEIFEEAIKNHYNIIFEGTMRTDQICHTIRHLQEEGYKINILAMAVPEIKSRISIYSRYQEQLEKYPIARFTSRFSHDEAYHGMIDTLQKIEKEHLYDTITICNREGDVIFSTGDQDIAQAIISERQKNLTNNDIKDLNTSIDVLLQKMQQRGENPDYLEDLKNLKQTLPTLSPQNFSKSMQGLKEKVKSIKNTDSLSQNSSFHPLQKDFSR